MSGKKFDSGKPDLSLIPLSALIEEAKGFMLGERKYGRYNYSEGMEASRLVGAALRHILAWQQGENQDPESGASHLGHARCCLAMLLECERLGTLKDNRNLVKEKAPSLGTTFRTRPLNDIDQDAGFRLPDGSHASLLEWNPLDYIK